MKLKIKVKAKIISGNQGATTKSKVIKEALPLCFYMSESLRAFFLCDLLTQ